MPEEIAVEIHGKDVSDFQLGRLVRASHRKYSVPITAFISNAFIAEDSCVGISFEHSERNEAYGKADGSILRTEKYTAHGKKGVSGCLKLETAITSLAALCGMSDGGVF